MPIGVQKHKEKDKETGGWRVWDRLRVVAACMANRWSEFTVLGTRCQQSTCSVPNCDYNHSFHSDSARETHQM